MANDERLVFAAPLNSTDLPMSGAPTTWSQSDEPGSTVNGTGGNDQLAVGAPDITLVALDGFAFDGFADVAASMQQVGSDTILDLGNGSSLTLPESPTLHAQRPAAFRNRTTGASSRFVDPRTQKKRGPQASSWRHIQDYIAPQYSNVLRRFSSTIQRYYADIAVTSINLFIIHINTSSLLHRSIPA